MRSSLHILAGLLLSVGAVAQPFSLSDPGFIFSSSAAAAGCESSDTTLPNDTLLEGFEGGYENVWTEVGTVANIDDAADTTSLTTGKPTGACNTGYCLLVPTDGTETYSRWNYGSLIDLDTQAVDVYFYFYCSDIPEDAENYSVFALRETSGGNSVSKVSFRNNSGTLDLRAVGTTTSTASTMTEDQWALIKLHLDTTAANSYIQVDGGVQQAFTRGAYDLQYVLIGATENLDLNDSGTIYFDLVCIEQL